MAGYGGDKVLEQVRGLVDRSRHVGTNVTLYTGRELGRMPLWNKKIFREQPVLAEGGGDIARFRKWYRQFYSVAVEVPI